MIRTIVTLRGRVQAVGFREQVIAIARGHPVAGSVRNLRAGHALEIDVEGDPEAVAAFVADVLAHPPPFARIDAVERSDAPVLGRRGFGRAATG